ncbi:hypothetical protein FOA52_001664 [Chlamydomonas sp. UWO 241]|nr:hypothetical protein FOA52_001664 [Chlamydomonas sp. UWO 241]
MSVSPDAITYLLLQLSLSVGPVAITSLLLGGTLGSLVPCAANIANPNTLTNPVDAACQDQYNLAALHICFIVACLYTGMGILRVGWITKFLSHAVIGGFTTGAAIIIGMGQAKYILGYTIVMPGKSTRLQEYLVAYFSRIKYLRWQEYIMGIMFIFILIAIKNGERLWRPLRHMRSLGAIFCCVVGILAVYIGKINTLPHGGMKIVGAIPKGLPPFTGNLWVPMVDPSFSELIVGCIIILIVDLIESTSIARALARKNGYELSYNREIVGLGLANFAGAMSSCYTTTGSFSRSAVNNNAGAKTPLAQFFCGWVVGFVLLFLTSVFALVPFNALGAIVIVSVASLVEIEQAIFLWKVNKLDLVCFLASCFGTLFYSVELGLGLAIGLAIFISIHQSAFPHTAVLGKVPGASYVYRNIKQYPDSQVYPGILAFRIDAPLYFANVNSVEEKIEKAMIKASAWSAVQGAKGLKFLIIDMTPIHHVDSMGLRFIEDVIFDCKDKGVQLLLSNPNQNVMRDWDRVKIPDLLGRDFVFVSVHEATIFALQRLSEMGFSTTPLALPTGSGVPSVAAMAAAKAGDKSIEMGSAAGGSSGGAVGVPGTGALSVRRTGTGSSTDRDEVVPSAAAALAAASYGAHAHAR